MNYILIRTNIEKYELRVYKNGRNNTYSIVLLDKNNNCVFSRDNIPFKKILRTLTLALEWI